MDQLARSRGRAAQLTACLRSANLTEQAALRCSGAENNETNAGRRGLGEGSRDRGASVSAGELDRGLSASAPARASTAVRGTAGE